MVDGKRIVQATTIVTGIALVVKGLGFVEKLLLAYFFGTGIEVDAYLVAYGIVFSAYVVLREVIKPSFLPTFLRTLHRTREDGLPTAADGGWRLFAIVGTLLFLLLSIVTVLGVVFAEPLVSLVAPGFTGEQRVLAVWLTRATIPALLLLGVSTLTTATLNAQKRFTLPALGDVSFRAGPLLFLLLAGSVPGMAVGVVLGALAKLSIETFGLRRYLRGLRPLLDLSFPPVRTVGRLAAPLFAGFFFSLFVGPLVENAFASQTGVGGVAALGYARKIAETLTTILPYTLGLVLLPFSAEMAARHDQRALASTLSRAVQGLTLIFMPVTMGLMVLREPFVRLLLERGAFTAASTQLTAGPLLFYAVALLPFALEVVVVQFFFARQDTLTPVITDVVTFAVNVALIVLLMGPLGLGGIALSAAIAKGLKVLALLLLFGRRVPEFRVTSLGPFAGQVAVASLVTAATLALYLVIGRSLASEKGFVALAVYLAGGGIAGGLAFFLTCYILKVHEVRELVQRGWNWLRSSRSA